jgi:hypothetical protein
MSLVAPNKTCLYKPAGSSRPKQRGRTVNLHPFRVWLRGKRQHIRKLKLRHILALYEGNISMSAAYRAAVAEGLRGKRHNDTRYETFWALINWELPDTMLQRIWGVWRGNLRHRRLRMNLGAARFNLRYCKLDSEFRQAVAREKRRAAHYCGPRPR